MRCKADGAQEIRHIMEIGEFSSTTQRSRSLAQTIIQHFPNSNKLYLILKKSLCLSYR